MSKVFLLLGGWTRNESSYQKLISTAPENVKIIFVPHSRLELKDVPRSVNDFIIENKLIKINLVGHSLGGAIAIEYAALFPGSISRLYLIDSEGVYGNEKVFKHLINFLKTRFSHARHLFALDFASFVTMFNNPFFHINLGKYAHFANYINELKSVRVPTTIMWGEKDHITPLWQAEEMKRLIPNSTLVILPEEGHDWILQKPELFWKKNHSFI